MAVKNANGDNQVDPNSKPRWGFGVVDGQVRVGVKTVGETGGVETLLHDREGEDDAARMNGGGVDGQVANLEGQLRTMDGENRALSNENLELKAKLQQLEEQRLAGLPTFTAAELEDKTVAQLKELLDERSIQYASSDNKPQLIALLKPTE